MKTIKIVVACMLTAILSTSAMAQNENKDSKETKQTKEQLVVPLSEPGKPFKLNIGLINGGIKVIGYEGKDVVIDIVTEEKVRKERDREGSAGLKRINAGNGMEVTAEERNNTVTVNTQSWKSGGLQLTVKVPMSESVMKLTTHNDGDILVSNVNAQLEIHNSNGGVTLTNIDGSAVVSAYNKAIKASFKSVDPKAAMAFSSLNGNIDVTFPATYKANIKLKTDHGDMFTDFDIDADKTQPEAKKTASGGTYRVNIDNSVYGKINGGGPELMIKNMNGNIFIRKAK